MFHVTIVEQQTHDYLPTCYSKYYVPVKYRSFPCCPRAPDQPQLPLIWARASETVSPLFLSLQDNLASCHTGHRWQSWYLNLSLSYVRDLPLSANVISLIRNPLSSHLGKRTELKFGCTHSKLHDCLHSMHLSNFSPNPWKYVWSPHVLFTPCLCVCILCAWNTLPNSLLC